MNFSPTNLNLNQTNFKAFKPFSPSYLRNNLNSKEIENLSTVVDNIKNTEYYDLEVNEDGFEIVDKNTKKRYGGNLDIETFGMWGEGGTWLVDNNYHQFKDKKLVKLKYLEPGEWQDIQLKYYINGHNATLDNGVKQVYYTDLLETNEKNRINMKEREKLLSKQLEDLRLKSEEDIKKEKALNDLLNKCRK